MRELPPDLFSIKGEKHDRKYFAIVPRIISLFARDPYDLAFWLAVKDIAGEDGECMLSSPELAAYAKMSTGKACMCRDYWLDLGLLEGEVRRDPGYSQPCWHLRIPDVWGLNIKVACEFIKLKERIEIHKAIRQERESFHLVKAMLSRDEKGLSWDEKGLSWGERKKNHIEEPSSEPVSDGELQEDDPFDLLQSDNPLSAHVSPELSQKNIRDVLDMAAHCEEQQEAPGAIQTVPTVSGSDGDPYAGGPLRAWCNLISLDVGDALPAWARELRRVTELCAGCGPEEMEIALKAIQAARAGYDIDVEGWWDRGYPASYLYQYKEDDGRGFSMDVRPLLSRARKEGREWWAFPISGAEGEPPPPDGFDSWDAAQADAAGVSLEEWRRMKAVGGV